MFAVTPGAMLASALADLRSERWGETRLPPRDGQLADRA